jgi:putative thioredoxin
MDVTQDSFYSDVLLRSHERPVVVDFWAAWCAPCRALAPVLEREVAARAGQIELAKVDTDANPELAKHYEIRGIPDVRAFRNGRVVDGFTGAQSAPSVAAFLDRLLAPSPADELKAQLRESGDEPELLAALDADDYERALELLLTEARAADSERRDEIRRLMLALFAELGQDDPVAAKYRRQLATALY